MSAVILTSGLILLALAVHPFVTYPLSLYVARRFLCVAVKQKAAVSSSPVVSFSLLTCAYKESAVVDQLARNRKKVIEAADAEVLIYDDASPDETAALLTRYGAPIRVVQSAIRHGKTFGMNRLAEIARGDILVFSDANVILAPDILDRLVTYFNDPSIGCVCGHLTYINESESATAHVGGSYWKLEEKIKALESATGSTMGADGSLFAVRRALYRPVPDHFIDDMYLSLSILLAGYRVVSAPDVRAFERSATRAADEFRRKARIACQAFNVHRALRSRLARMSPWNRYKYVSHKPMRWLAPFTCAFGLALTSSGLFMFLNPASQALIVKICAATIGTVLILRPKALGFAWNVVLAFAGVGLGILQSLFGARYQTWTPAESVR